MLLGLAVLGGLLVLVTSRPRVPAGVTSRPPAPAAEPSTATGQGAVTGVRPARSGAPVSASPSRPAAAVAGRNEGLAVSVHGRVLDRRSGRPVQGAAVKSETGAQSALTAADGSYGLDLLNAPAMLVLSASAPGYRPLATSVALLDGTSSEETDFLLEPATRLTGRVLSTRGLQPIPGARVRFESVVSLAASLENAPGRVAFEACPEEAFARERAAGVTDARGRFELEACSRDGWLEVEAAGHAFERTALQMPAGREPGPVEILLRPGHRLQGRVVAPEDRPVAGSTVWLSVPDRLGQQRRATSGADGAFRFEGVELRSACRLVVEHPHFLRSIGEPFVLEAAAAPVVVRLQPAGRILGTVLDAHGEPLGGLEVEAWRLEPSTARRGRLMGQDLMEAARGESFEDADLIGLEPVLLRVPTREDGSFALESLEPGTYRISASSGTWTLARTGNVQVSAGADVEGVLVRVPGSERVRGRVLDAAGLPLRGVSLVIRNDECPALPLESMPRLLYGFAQPRAQSAADGSYEIGPIEPGRQCLVAMREDWIEARAIDVPAGSVDFVVPASGLLHGTVLDGATEQPVQQFLVAADRDEMGLVPGAAHPFSSQDGSFELRLPPVAGTMRIAIWAAGYRSARLVHHRLDQAGGSGQRPLQIRLKRAPTLSGILRDPAGQPLAGAAIRVRSDRAELCRYGLPIGFRPLRYTEPDGSFFLDCLEPGPLSLAVRPPDGTVARVDLTLPDEGLEDFEVRLARGASTPLHGP